MFFRVLRRFLGAIPLLVIISLMVFLLIDLMPGDAAVALAGENASGAQIAQTRERLGLNDPFLVRYLNWLAAAAQGDLGQSLYGSQRVTDTILERLPVTASIAMLAMLITIVVGLPLGILAARTPNSLLDRVLSMFAAISMAVPPFILGLLLVVVFAVTLSWLPPTGYSGVSEAGLFAWLRSIILPSVAIAAVPVAELARQTRGALIDALGMDYIRTVRAKGIGERQVVLRHAIKNAGVPIATVLGIQVNRVLAGSVTVEFVFAVPGFGALALTAVSQRDVPMILGVVMVSALIVVVVNVITDMSYGLFNPRLRTGE